MKITKFIALSAIAIMAIGIMGFMSTKVHAQSGTLPAPQVQVTDAPENQPATGPDTDQAQVEEQVGSQSGVDSTIPSTTSQSITSPSTTSPAAVALGTASEAVEPASKDGQDAAPTGTPSITAETAIKAAQAYLNSNAAGTATLDDENGKLVYSVDLNGSDVKVDAISGTVLGVDQAGGGQTESAN